MTSLSELAIARDVPARMRDGVVLRANVYRPTGDGPWPTLLARTPYGKDLPGAAAWLDPVRAAAAGFIVAIQDVRGRFASEGSWEPFEHEGNDGYDAVEWAARLPGSNGRVGMFGLSYWGSTQWLAAIAQPPSLEAIAPAMTWSDPEDGLRRGGASELALALVWALEQAIGPDASDALIDQYDRLSTDGFWELPAGAPIARHGLVEVAGPVQLAAARIAGRQHEVRVPVLGIGGWHDAFVQGTIDNHLALAALGRDSSLVIGPWSHANFGGVVGERSYGMRARRDGGPAGGPDDLTALQLAWLRGHLTDGAGPPKPRVRIFAMGADEWREPATWPPPGTRPARWHLRAGGQLTTEPAAAPEPHSRFVHDPNDPVPTIGGATLTSGQLADGPADQAAVEGRADVLVFSTEPLPADLEVTGRVRVSLHGASPAPSADWVARLCDVDRDGRSWSVCDGIRRSDRDVRQAIDLGSTCHRFAAGHRLRLQIAGSSFPRWDRNPHAGEQRVDHAGERASWLEVEVSSQASNSFARCVSS